MKKILSFFMLTLLTAGFSAKAADEIYAVWDESSTTLTLRYDAEREAQGGVTDWSAYKATATTVVFDASMQNARPTGTKEWFKFFEKLTAIQHLDYLNTSEVTDMSSMFYGCKALTSLDLSKFNTEKVTDMSYMFNECRALTSLTLGSSFSTANVTTMSSMFCNCNALTSLDLSNFNTANVKYMSFMFYGCQALTSLDLSKFNTEKVTNMLEMFGWCNALTSLDLSKFNTEKVTDMYQMFYECQALTTLTLGSSFSTANVTDMSYMFSHCEQLTSLDISKFNTEKVTSMKFMFSGCSALTALDFSSFSTANVTTMECMFQNCYALTSLDLSKFTTEKVTNMSAMFFFCQALTTIYWDVDLSGRTDINAGGMFSACDKLVGGNGTEYDNNITDNTYALPDGVNGKKGYFTTFDMNDKTRLYAYIQDMQRLYNFAEQYVPESELESFKSTINTFRDTYNTGTDDNIKIAAGLAPMMLENAIGQLIDKGKTALKALLDGKLQTGDNQTCTDIISGAKAKIDALAWDDSKTVAENIAMLDAAVKDIIADADNDLANARISTGIEEADSQKPEVVSQKIMRNGSIYILRDGKTYTLTGAEVIP